MAIGLVFLCTAQTFQHDKNQDIVLIIVTRGEHEVHVQINMLGRILFVTFELCMS